MALFATPHLLKKGAFIMEGTSILSKFFVLLSGFILIVAGVFCIVQPTASLLSIAYFVGFFILLTGLMSVFYYFQTPKAKHDIWGILIAILDIITGSLVVFFGAYGAAIMATVISIVFALSLIMRGSFGLVNYSALKEIIGSSNLYVAATILEIIAGVILLFNPIIAAITVSYILGFGFLMAGLSSFVIYKGL